MKALDQLGPPALFADGGGFRLAARLGGRNSIFTTDVPGARFGVRGVVLHEGCVPFP